MCYVLTKNLIFHPDVSTILILQNEKGDEIMKYLFIAEKPSLMFEIKSCYNNHKPEIISKIGYIDFIALTGHICENFSPNDYPDWKDKAWEDITYPIIPNRWGIKPIQDKHKKETLTKIKSMIHNYDGIIVGTDSDTEGYGIYYNIEQYLGLQQFYTLRFIEHSLTDQEILRSLLTMTDYHKDPVHIHNIQSFLLRSRTDWLYGQNGTMLMSVKSEDTQHVGRVKAPTVKMVYDNSIAIEQFKPETYHVLCADYGNGFVAQSCDEKGNILHYPTVETAPTIKNKDGIVKEYISQEKNTSAPKLYDLAAIQSEAGKMFGYTPDYTTSLLQSLYENHKVLSYPRTQCRYISEEKAKELIPLLKTVSVFPELQPFLKKVSTKMIQSVMQNKSVVNTKEVEKESHDALLPTGKMPELEKMTADEIQICRHIYKRLLAQFLPKLKEEKTTVITEHDGVLFIARGKTIKELGWRELYGPLKDAILPSLNKGDVVHANTFKTEQKVTSPPKRLTQATLIEAMMNIANSIEDPVLRNSLKDSKGIGKASTRHSIIKDLLKHGYFIDKKGLYITEKGKKYVSNLSDIQLINPIFAAQLDYNIKMIQRGEASYESMYQETLNGLYDVCEQIKNKTIHVERNPELVCPKCGTQLSIKGTHYCCQNKECDFNIASYVCGATVSEENIIKIIHGKSSDTMTFKKKDKSSFKAKLIMNEDYTLGFNFDSGITCPYCHKDVVSNKAGYFCECGLKVYNPCFGKKLTDEDAKTLIETKKLGKRSGFKNKEGKKYSASLILKNKKVEIKF